MSSEVPYRLRLYVTGRGVLSRRAERNIRQICEHDLDRPVDIDIIDVTADPARAEEARILATPTLIKELPEPLRRIVGDLTDRGVVLAALDANAQGDMK